MISPAPGVAFTEEVDGDMLDAAAVGGVAHRLDIRPDWAVVSQVHGSVVRTASVGGNQGEGDAVVTEQPALPVAVRTADCVGIVAHAPGRVGAAHAGWRGLVAGILQEFATAMGGAARYYVGPSIGPCCYEVGVDVAELFPDHVSTTTALTRSVDLRSATRAILPSIEWMDDRCTMCGPGLPSHRRDGTRRRIAAVGWL